MTANWPPPGQQPPGQPPQPPPPAYPYHPQPPPGYGPQDAPPGYGYNWGLAYPAAAYQPIAWVPRPPRPGVVNLAVLLTLLGVLVSGVQLVINLVHTYATRGDLISQLNTGAPNTPGLASTSVDIILVIAVAVWLLPAAGAVVAVLLARRGANAARIVLASLMGVFALNDLCGGVFGLVNTSMGGVRSARDASTSPAFDLVLAVLAIAIGVLVLVPPANRFFSAGPGRRFMPST